MGREHEQALNLVALALSASPEAIKGLVRERAAMVSKIKTLEDTQKITIEKLREVCADARRAADPAPYAGEGHESAEVWLAALDMNARRTTG